MRPAVFRGVTGKECASNVFSDNTTELMNHLTEFVGTMLHVNELPDDFDVEANRLLHNYLAALATLRDVQRAIHRQLWPDKYAPDDKDDKRTKWQVAVWEPRFAATNYGGLSAQRRVAATAAASAGQGRLAAGASPLQSQPRRCRRFLSKFTAGLAVGCGFLWGADPGPCSSGEAGDGAIRLRWSPQPPCRRRRGR